jgi:hypothetical protein
MTGATNAHVKTVFDNSGVLLQEPGGSAWPGVLSMTVPAVPSRVRTRSSGHPALAKAHAVAGMPEGSGSGQVFTVTIDFAVCPGSRVIQGFVAGMTRLILNPPAVTVPRGLHGRSQDGSGL